MLWVTWTIPPLVSSLVLCLAVLVIWAAEPQVNHLNLLVVLVCLLVALSLAPEHASAVFETIRSFAAAVVTDFRLESLLFTHVNMLVSGAAFIWLLRRALQTLWKPVPELIDILGVDVPAPPDVSLTAIGVDKATITWTRPAANRAVEKYVIQVNGVNVGESATNQDTFITVSGLKPNHFYNVRIIAVGSNNFQAGSRVLRLRTFGSDGRPRLGTSRLPSDFTDGDAASASRQHEAASSGADENGNVKHFVTSTFGVAQPLPSDGAPTLTRESSSSIGQASSSRRNTVNRRHSPSTTSLDQQQQLQQQNLIQQINSPSAGLGVGAVAGAGAMAGGDEDAGVTEAQMAELNQRYLNLRKETEETAAMIVKEEEDQKKLLDELEAEKAAKRQEQKRKEEQTEKLRKEQGTTERTMRQSLQRKTQLEKRLRDKNAELERMREETETWDASIKEMREEQESYNKQRTQLDEEHQAKANELRERNKSAQTACTELEAELKEKRGRIKELEDERTNLVSNGDDAEWRTSIVELRKSWQRQELEYRTELLHENRRQQGLDSHIHILSAQLQQIPQAAAFGGYNPAANAAMLSALNAAGTGAVNPAMNPANMPLPSGFELDPTAMQNHVKRRSRTSVSLSSGGGAVPSPVPAFSLVDLTGPPSSSTPPYTSIARPPTQSGFLTGPFMGSSADHPEPDDTGFRTLTAGAPLSPSATSLLPSNIFADDELPSPSLNAGRFSPFISLQQEQQQAESRDAFGSLNDATSNTVDSNSSSQDQESQGNGHSKAADAAATAATRKSNHENNNCGGGSNPQSPAPSSRSMSILSSPRGSSQNLPYPVYSLDTADGRSSLHINGLPSPTVDSATQAGQSANSTRFGIFPFSRASRGTSKTLDEGGPALGSLKHGQSQSFPRQGEEAMDGSKGRRISLSSWGVFNRNSIGGPEIVESQPTPTTLLNKSNGFSARNLFPFGSRAGGNPFTGGRVPNSPRPNSLASIDMPRPSTDSGSIWGPPEDGGAAGSAGVGKGSSRLWPSDNAWPSRTPSRRPSIHGSPSALKTNLASADDKILDETELLNPETSPSQVGVIGSRPPAAGKKASSALGKALNPAAPTFMANIFRPKTEKDKDRDKDKDKDKDDKKDKEKERERDKDKDKEKPKGKGKLKGRDKEKDKSHKTRNNSERDETPGVPPDTPATSGGNTLPSLIVDELSPSNSRMSRDGQSVRTQTSMSVSESRESLDYIVSNTASVESNSLGLLSSSKDSSENALLKLFRKESTGKLSFSRRIGRTKTGPGSLTSSDKNMSAGRSSFGDYEDSVDESVLLSQAGSRGTGVAGGGGQSQGQGHGQGQGQGGVDSVTSSPSLGPSKSRDKAESKLKPASSWFSIKKKNREKESLDLEREPSVVEQQPDASAAAAAAAAAAAEDSNIKSL